LDTYLKSTGLNSDPNHVFKVENGVLHISGTEFGYLITKPEFQNYICVLSSSGAREPSLPGKDTLAIAEFSTMCGANRKSGRAPSSFRLWKVEPATSG
jgi:hypothetical protein